VLGACGHGRTPPRGLPGLAITQPTPGPAPTWSAGERAGLQGKLSSIFRSPVTSRATGIVVVDENGSTLFARRGTVPVAPASTLKLVIAATALDALGPQRRFETRFVATQAPDLDGTLAGDLWLVGGGDPTLASNDLRAGVGAMYRAGVRRIDGALDVDDTAFSGPEQNPRWDPDDLSYDYAAGTSAISLDDDAVSFDVTPAAPGQAARVEPNPPNASISFDGSIATVPAGYSSYVTIERKPQLAAVGSASRTMVEPHNEYVLDGRIAAGEKQTFLKPVVGMPGYVGGVAASMLAARGMDLAGGFRTSAAPLGAYALWTHRSPPLADIVREMLVNSNNHTAETLLRIVGETSGRPGTDAAGIAFEKHVLSQIGVPHAGMALYDGSGLAASDRIAPLTLARLVAHEARTPSGDAFVRGLPRVGIEGTVRIHDVHAALGRVRAKSGHIANVNGLAGEVQTRRHGRIAFAFIANDPRADDDDVYREIDRALDALAVM